MSFVLWKYLENHHNEQNAYLIYPLCHSISFKHTFIRWATIIRISLCYITCICESLYIFVSLVVGYKCWFSIRGYWVDAWRRWFVHWTIPPEPWRKASSSMSVSSRQTTPVCETATLLYVWMGATFTSRPSHFYSTRHSQTPLVNKKKINTLLQGVFMSIEMLLLYMLHCVPGFQKNTTLLNPMTTGHWDWWHAVPSLSWRSWRTLSSPMDKVTSLALCSREPPPGSRGEQGRIYPQYSGPGWL